MQSSSDAKPFKSGYVAIVGKPNVGKSTLLNNLLQFKVAAVTRKPQTTRHQIRGIFNGDDCQVIFVDTPGLLAPKYKLQEAMLGAALRALQEADLTLIMVEARSRIDEQDLAQIDEISSAAKKVILVLNKIDLIKKEDLLPLIQFLNESRGIKTIIPVSALKSDGLEALKKEIIAVLPDGLPYYSREQVTDHPERFLAAEIIREKIFLRYGDEIPYSTTVEIDTFKERDRNKDFVRAIIYVERKSQKGILIGKKGVSLKEIGRQARVDIEELLGRGVYLELWVRVKEKWRQNEIMLKEFGYYK